MHFFGIFSWFGLGIGLPTSWTDFPPCMYGKQNLWYSNIVKLKDIASPFIDCVFHHISGQFQGKFCIGKFQ